MSQRRLFELLTRIGFAARGLLYIVIGLLVIRAGRAEDPSGVFEYLAGGVGNMLLLAMASGFAAYGLWRLADAAFAIECRGEDHEAARRVGAGVSGIVHLFLAKQSFDVATGVSSLAENGTQQRAQDVLQLPAGQLLLGAIALGLLAAGVVQLVKAAKCSFLDRLDPQVRDTWVKWLGRTGYAARGAVFLVAGYFVGTAALANSSWRAGGVEQVLEWLAPPTNLLLAAGLLLFGIFGLVEARYRRIRTPDPSVIEHQVTDAAAG